MNAMKRLCLTMNAHLNALIDQVENHEAVAEAALGEIQDSLLKAKFQLRRIQSEQKRLEENIQLQRGEETRWRERAIRSEKDDREKAIECVRRMKKAQNEIEAKRAQAEEHRELEKQLSADVRTIEAKFEELKRRRSALAARESRAEAFQSLHRHQSGGQLDGAFERWERAVMRSEVAGETVVDCTDALAQEMTSDEEKKELETVLSELVTEKKEA